MSDTPSQHLDKFIIRLPDGLRERIRDAAKVNNRSMNAEVVAALEEKFPPPNAHTAVLSNVFGLLMMLHGTSGAGDVGVKIELALRRPHLSEAETLELIGEAMALILKDPPGR